MGYKNVSYQSGLLFLRDTALLLFLDIKGVEFAQEQGRRLRETCMIRGFSGKQKFYFFIEEDKIQKIEEQKKYQHLLAFDKILVSKLRVEGELRKADSVERALYKDHLKTELKKANGDLEKSTHIQDVMGLVRSEKGKIYCFAPRGGKGAFAME